MIMFLQLPMIHLSVVRIACTSGLMLLCIFCKKVLGFREGKGCSSKEIADLKKESEVGRKKKSDTQGRSDDADMFDIDDLHGDEVNVDMPVGDNQEQSVKEREVDTSVKDIVTTAATTTTTTGPKARGVVVQDLARNLQAQLEAEIIEEEKLARKQEEEANIALIESWDNTQAMMEADFELAQRLQTETRRE
ncbi:hypothetical protein Tco_1184221 [Tanacetum coccineum]